MNKLQRLSEGYYTQVEEVATIEDRIFVKEIAGVRATTEYFRMATDEELAAWEALKKKQAEEQAMMSGYENSNA